MPRSFAFLATLLALVVAGPAPVAAHDTTPPTRDAPLPEECVVAPRPLAFFEERLSPPAAPASPAATPSASGGPAAAPAPAATVAGVTATIREAIACLNAMDFARYYALHTEAGVARDFAGAPPERVEEFLAFVATPVAASEEQLNALDWVRDVTVSADGGIVAYADVYDAHVPGEATYVYGLVETGDRWLIDWISAEPAEGGTPTP